MILSIMNEYASGKFTFQSGDIQITPFRVLYIDAESFTFQSGDIQMWRDSKV